MTDIVERLREHRMTTDWQVAVSEAHEAAAEIVRLRGELADAETDAAHDRQQIRENAAIITAFQAENAKLRAALMEIRDAGPMTIDDQRWRIALAALGGKND